MNKIQELFNELIFAVDQEDFRKQVDKMVLSGGYEIAYVFSQYCHYSQIKENVTYIIRSFVKFPDVKSVFRVLVELSYTTDPELKLEILKVIRDLRHPIFSYRLYYIFINTKSDEIKLMIIKIFLLTGVSLFARRLLIGLERDSHKVQLYVLYYLANKPFIHQEDVDHLESKLDDIVAKADNEQQENQVLALLHLLHIKRPFNKNKLQRIVRNARLPHAFLQAQFNTSHEVKKHRHTSEYLGKSLMSEDNREVWDMAFEKDTVEKLAGIIREKLVELEGKNQRQYQLLSRNLTTLNTYQVFDVLLDALESSSRFTYKQHILDTVIYFNIDEERRDRLKSICLELLKDRKHIRIFESVARNLVLVFRQEGLEALYDSYSSIADTEHKAMVISGINQAIQEYGYGKHITSRDLYHLQMIIQSTLEFLRKGEVEGQQLFTRLCRLIYYIHSDTYMDELLSMMKKYQSGGITPDALRMLVSIGKETAIKRLSEILEVLAQSPADNAELLRLIFMELCRHTIRFPELISEDVLLRLLDNPLYTADVILFFFKYDLVKYTETVLKFAETHQLHLKYHLLLFLSRTSSGTYTDQYALLFNSSEPIIKKMAAARLINSGDLEIIKNIYRYYILGEGSFNDFSWVAGHLMQDVHVLRRNYQALLLYKGFEEFAPFRQAARDIAFRLFTLDNLQDVKSWEEDNGAKTESDIDPDLAAIEKILPKDARRAIFTAEKFYQFYIRDNEKQDDPEKYDVFGAVNEYRKFARILMRMLIQEKISYLTGNNDYIHSLTHIFKNALNYVDFFNRENLWLKVDFDADILQELIRLIVSRDGDSLKKYFDSLQKIIHLLCMVLCDNEFYSIVNPMGYPLELFEKHKIVRSLDSIEKMHDEMSQKKLRSAREIIDAARQCALNIIRFYREYTLIPLPAAADPLGQQ